MKNEKFRDALDHIDYSFVEEYVEEKEFTSLHFLYNNSYLWEKTGICGTRGWTIPSSTASPEDKKIFEREKQRLILSLEDAISKKTDKIIVAMHYPPVENGQAASDFLSIMKEYGVEKCIFGHLHAASHTMAPIGNFDGIQLKLVACDYLDFMPLLLHK